VPSFGAKEAVTKKPGLAGCCFHGVVAASQLGGHLPVPSFGKFHLAACGHFFMLMERRTQRL
jgi:tRNA A37 threonylcarbamoyltransferase TsaD